ncbi:MAG: DUF4350 domain-containing protein [Acidobacteriota bacterium]
MRRLSSAALLVLCLAFSAGLIRLLSLRFSTGDVYPAYSSLRADPLGTKALYEAIGMIEGCSVQRNYGPADDIPSGKGRTLVVAGLHAFELKAAAGGDISDLADWTNRGGRLIIALYPATYRPEEEKEESSEKKPEKRSAPRDGCSTGSPARGIERLWGFELEPIPPTAGSQHDRKEALATRTVEVAMLPPSVPWHSALAFRTVKPGWRPILVMNGSLPVVVERAFGQGTVVLCSDSYLLSNEAMKKDRQPAFLTWLIGSSSTVIFDETHLGVSDPIGVVSLIRGYGLDGLLLGLAALALLFVWKNAVSFLPPLGSTGGERSGVQGRDSTAAFVSLLRRNLRDKDVLRVCLDEWKRTAGSARRMTPEQIAQMAAVVERSSKSKGAHSDIAAAYRDLCDIVRRSQT